MVVAVPSVKPGAPQPYRWKNPPPLFDLADCPEWLLRLAAKPERKLSERAMPGARIDTGARWADAALRNEIAAVLAAPDGTRNDALNTAAFNLGQIIAGGGLAEGMVVARLTAAAEAAGLRKQVQAEAGPEPDHLDFARAAITRMGRDNVLCAGPFVWRWDACGVWRQQDDRAIKQVVQAVIDGEEADVAAA